MYLYKLKFIIDELLKAKMNAQKIIIKVLQNIKNIIIVDLLLR